MALNNDIATRVFVVALKSLVGGLSSTEVPKKKLAFPYVRLIVYIAGLLSVD